MEQIKYIPGDLVSVYVGIKKYIVKVIGIKTENEVFLYQIKFPSGEIQYADKDNIVPIPLTPEILEKNGWQEGYGIYYYEDITVVYIDNYYWIIGLKEIDDILHIDYVHQLQHFLFGLDLNSDMNL